MALAFAAGGTLVFATDVEYGSSDVKDTEDGSVAKFVVGESVGSGEPS